MHDGEMKIAILALLLFVGTVRAQTYSQLQREANQFQAEIARLLAQVSALQDKVTALQCSPVQALGPFITVDLNPQNDVRGPNITFHGANIHIVNGAGQTSLNNGLGSLFIGYNEDPGTNQFDPWPLNPGDRSGSHNLILGRYHKYPNGTYASFIGGEENEITGHSASILGGQRNTAWTSTVVVGGYYNNAQQSLSVILGGVVNNIPFSGFYGSAIAGGYNNVLNGTESVLLGGQNGIFNDNFSIFQ